MRITTLIFDYRCSVCWSMLTEQNGAVVCAKYGTEHAGFHRISGIDWQRSHSEYNRLEVINLYIDIKPFCYQLGLATPPKSGAELQAAFERNRRAMRGNDEGF